MIPSIRGINLKMLLVLVVIATCSFVSYIQGAKSVELKYSRMLQASLKVNISTTNSLLKKIEEVDIKGTEELRRNEEKFIESINTAIGTNRLRFSFTLPSRGKESSKHSCMDSRTRTGELSRESDFFLKQEAHRADRAVTKLTTCQELLKEITK